VISSVPKGAAITAIRPFVVGRWLSPASRLEPGNTPPCEPVTARVDTHRVVHRCADDELACSVDRGRANRNLLATV
jgi:hypothetical protein